MSIDCADLINNSRAEENCCNYYILECLFWDNVNEIAKDINENKVTKDIALRCRSHNIATTYTFSIVYSNSFSHDNSEIKWTIASWIHKVWFSFSRQRSTLQKEFVEGWCSSSRKR